MNRYCKYVLILIFAGVFHSCEEEEYSPIPDLHFSIPLFLDDSEFTTLAYGTSIELDSTYGGYAGFIIYMVADGVFHAYDLCCPLHYEIKETLEIDGALAMCPTDSVYFPLQDGEPSIGMNTSDKDAILKSYRTSYSSHNNVLTIRN